MGGRGGVYTCFRLWVLSQSGVLVILTRQKRPSEDVAMKQRLDRVQVRS